MKFFLQLCCALALLCPAALARRCVQGAEAAPVGDLNAATGQVGNGASAAKQAEACPRAWPTDGQAARAGDAGDGPAGPARVLRYSFDFGDVLALGAEDGLVPGRGQGLRTAGAVGAVSGSTALGSGAPRRVHVALDLRIPASGSEVMALPSEWAETTGLERGIESLTVSGGRARLVTGPTPAFRVLRGTPGSAVRLTYDLAGDRGRVAGAAERHRVVLHAGLVEFNGSNGLVAPAMAAGERVHVVLRFIGLPAGQVVVTSFGEGEAQEMTGPWHAVRSALFAGGALRTKELVVQGAPVLLAIAGEWRFTDAEAAVKVRQILAAERMFWRDLAIPWYAVVIAPLEDEGAGGEAASGVGGGGTAFTHAFLLSLAMREGFGSETESLFAHEAFHEWNPLGMGSAGGKPTPAWFTEGVTTFYQDRLLERAKLLDTEEYLRRVNRIVRDERLLRDDRLRLAAGGRPVKDERSAREVQLDAEATSYRAPYLRGALMAMWLDAEIRRQTRGTRSLDDVMLALREDREQPLTAERVFRTAGYLVDAATVQRLRGFADRDGEVPFEAGGLAASVGGCVAVRERELWSFDLGIDPTELRHGAVLGSVREGSAAWRAGLRNGQTLEGWEMVTGDADHEVVMMVHGPAGRAEVHYLPRGEEVRVPQAEVVAGCGEGGGKAF